MLTRAQSIFIHTHVFTRLQASGKLRKIFDAFRTPMGLCNGLTLFAALLFWRSAKAEATRSFGVLLRVASALHPLASCGCASQLSASPHRHLGGLRGALPGGAGVPGGTAVPALQLPGVPALPGGAPDSGHRAG